MGDVVVPAQRARAPRGSCGGPGATVWRMDLPGLRASFLLTAAPVLSCGGQVAGINADAGSPVSTENPGNPAFDASSPGTPASPGNPGSTPDASTTTTPGVTCKQGPGTSGGSSGGGSCSLSLSESCTDGTTYNVSCTCPGGSCSCSEFSPQGGGSGGGGTFAGCADNCSPATIALAYKACGFPH
jgi:hypothetical protein